MNTGLIAIFIILFIIVGAISTKKCVEFLIAGSLVAALIMYKGSFITQWCTLIQTALSDNVWIIVVCGLFGSLIALLQAAKGSLGFAKLVDKLCNTEKKTLLTTFVLGILIFVDDYLNVLSIGVCMKGVFDKKKIIVEIKSLNSKNLDINTRLAPMYYSKEMQLRQIVASCAIRGKVDLCIKTEDMATPLAAVINVDVADSYVSQIKSISKELNIGEPEDWWSIIVRMPGVTQTLISEVVDDAEWKVVQETVEDALNHFVDFRKQEGQAVSAKFIEKIENITGYLREIETYEVLRVEKIRNQIIDKFDSLPIEYDKNRLEQEMIYYIEKLDINEEKQRLSNHLSYFLETMKSSEPQGKKLGFIAQEMGREINTMGSKSNLAEMQNLVVRMKDELEQIKEQVLNVL